MPFQHSIVIVPGTDFKVFLKSIEQIISESGKAYDEWNDYYEKSPVVIAATSKGSSEKITGLNELNQLYHGMIELYHGRIPTMNYQNLIIKEVNGHAQICIIFTSDDAINMKLDWAYASGLVVDYANRILVHYDEDGMAYNCGGIDLELCLFSTKHLKKKHDQEKMSDLIDIYNDILNFITSTSNSKSLEFESEGLKYVPKNSKSKPIYLR